MDQMKQFGAEFWNYLPYLIGGIAVFVVGWVVAWLLSGIVRSLVARTRLDDRLGTAMGKQPGEAGRLANWVAGAVFWIILALSVIGALSVLQLAALSESLRQAVDTVMRYLPQLLAAGALLLLAWITAAVLRLVIVRTLQKANLERRLAATRGAPLTASEQAAAGAAPPLESGAVAPTAPRNLAKSIGDVVYWLVFLLFLPLRS